MHNSSFQLEALKTFLRFLPQNRRRKKEILKFLQNSKTTTAASNEQMLEKFFSLENSFFCCCCAVKYRHEWSLRAEQRNANLKLFRILSKNLISPLSTMCWCCSYSWAKNVLPCLFHFSHHPSVQAENEITESKNVWRTTQIFKVEENW